MWSQLGYLLLFLVLPAVLVWAGRSGLPQLASKLRKFWLQPSPHAPLESLASSLKQETTEIDKAQTLPKIPLFHR